MIYLIFAKNFRKIFATFIPESTADISTIFRKFSQKFCQNSDKILLVNCSNFGYCSSKISRKFSLFCRIFNKISSHFNIFTISSKFLKIFFKI